MKYYLYTIILTLVLVLIGCADETSPLAQVPESSPQTERRQVPLQFEASLGGGSNDTRAVFTYDNNALKLTWGGDDAIGVYIKTADGALLRAGSLSNRGITPTSEGKTCVFSGYALQKFDGESYIYMHPDIGSQTSINLETQYGELNSTHHINNTLPMLWTEENSSGTFSCKSYGYVFKFNITFPENPGLLSKVTLHTSSNAGTSHDRIFPRQFTFNDIMACVSKNIVTPYGFTVTKKGTDTDIPASYTDAVSLNITGDGMPEKVDNKWTATVYLTSAQVNNLNVYDSKIRLEVLNEEGKTYTSTYESFKGQSDKSSTKEQELLVENLLDNNKVHSMTRTLSAFGISPTVINYQYNVNSILGMWDVYGKPYDPNGLICNGSDGRIAPTQLTGNEAAIKTRYKNAGTGASNTPTFMRDVYDTQNIAENSKTGTQTAYYSRQDNATCNNITITQDNTEVFVTFLSEYAWNQNLLGYYHYPKGNVPDDGNSIAKNIIYPNLSKPEHEPFNSNGKPANNIGQNGNAPLTEYETVKLVYINPTDGTASTKFPANTTIGFFMMIDVQANGFQQSQYSLLRWSQWRCFTNSAWNAANTGWTGNYNRCNFFASADVCSTTGNSSSDAESGKISGLALYGMKDNATNDAYTAYSTCLFMVSTSNPAAMETQNKCYFNIGSGQLVIIK